jgi:hypothetical protein
MDDLIRLQGKTPAFQGKEREIYAYPGHPKLLIKVGRNVPLGRRMVSITQRYRYAELASYVGELTDQLAMRSGGAPHPRHLQKIVGVVETDLGLGVVVEALFDRDGRYAPTLYQLSARQGIDDEARAELEKFARWMVRADIVLNDINARNIVYAHEDGYGSFFVLVDGYGGVPRLLERLWPLLHRASKKRKALRLLARYASGLRIGSWNAHTSA